MIESTAAVPRSARADDATIHLLSMNHYRFFFLASILLLAPVNAILAAGGYHVEALLFARPLNAQERDNETWPAAANRFWLPEPGLLHREIGTASGPDQQPSYRRVQARTLLKHRSRLVGNPKYQVLQLSAWELPPLKKARSPVIPLFASDNRPATTAVTSASVAESRITPRTPVDGGIQTYILGNFLYLLVDICRSTAIDIASTNPQPTTTTVRFCIKEKRRIKLGELNYFDHPGMGLLVRVDRAVNFTLPAPAAIPTNPAVVKSTGE